MCQIDKGWIVMLYLVVKLTISGKNYNPELVKILCERVKKKA